MQLGRTIFEDGISMEQLHVLDDAHDDSGTAIHEATAATGVDMGDRAIDAVRNETAIDEIGDQLEDEVLIEVVACVAECLIGHHPFVERCAQFENGADERDVLADRKVACFGHFTHQEHCCSLSIREPALVVVVEHDRFWQSGCAIRQQKSRHDANQVDVETVLAFPAKRAGRANIVDQALDQLEFFVLLSRESYHDSPLSLGFNLGGRLDTSYKYIIAKNT